MTLTKDSILGLDDLPVEAIQIPEWKDLTVYVRTMTGTERDQYEGRILSLRGKPLEERLKSARAQLVVLCMTDENGKRLFTDDDAEAVGGKNADALNRVATAASKLNSLDAKTVDEKEGN